MRSSQVYVCVGLLFVGLAPLDAFATRCGPTGGGEKSGLVLPRDGATDVAIDSMIAVGWGLQDEDALNDIRLLGPDGPVALEAGEGFAGNRVLLPIEELDADASFQIRLDGIPLGTFTTGSRFAAPPEMPTLLTARVERGVKPPGPCARAAATTELEFVNDGFLSAFAFWGAQEGVRSVSEVTVGDDLRVRRLIEDLHVGGLSEAGEFTGWSDPVALDVPAAGCTTTTEFSGAWFLGLFGIAFLRRSCWTALE